MTAGDPYRADDPASSSHRSDYAGSDYAYSAYSGSDYSGAGFAGAASSDPDAPAPTAKRARRGRILLGVGAVVLVAALAFLGSAAWALVREMNALQNAPVATSGTPMVLELEAGESRTVWAQDHTPYDAWCDLRNQSGGQPELNRGGSTSYEINERTFEKEAEYTAIASGTHVLTCTGTFSVTGSEVGGAGTILRFILGVFALIAAVFLLVLGTVWTLGGKSHVVLWSWNRPDAPRTPPPPRHPDQGNGPTSTAYEPPGL